MTFMAGVSDTVLSLVGLALTTFAIGCLLIGQYNVGAISATIGMACQVLVFWRHRP